MKNDGGFTYIGLLAVIIIIGVMTAVVGRTWRATSRIEKETELLWTGHQFRRAIKAYYNYGKDHYGSASYPAELKDLLVDPRSGGTHRYLRKIYPDPMTGKKDWGLITDVSQHIIGVHSLSEGKTLKRDNFDLEDEGFKGKEKYSEWAFIVVPSQ